MSRTMTYTELKQALPTLPEKLSKKRGGVTVTRGGKPVLAVMSIEEYRSLTETRAIKSDPEIMRAIRQGEKDLAAGRMIPWEKVKRDLKI